MQASPDGAILVDATEKILCVNPAVERTLGYSPGELVGQSVEMLVPEAARASHPAQVAGFFRDPRPVAIGLRGNLHARHKSGTEIPVEIGLTPVQLDDQTLVLAMVRDITERVRASDRLRAILQSAPTAMILVNGEAKIVTLNAEAERTFGYTHDEVVDQPVETLVPEEYRARHADHVQRFFANPQPRALGTGGDLYGRRKDGSKFPVELALGPAKLENDLFVVATVVDITERKRMEREFGTARRIQEMLLPTKVPQLAGFQIAGMWRPAHETGGDFFDYVELPGQRLAIVLGDAMGHGFGPALLTTTTRASIRTLLRTQDSLSRVLQSTNEMLAEDSPGDQFITCVLIELDASSRSLVFSAAGHDAHVVSSRGEVRHHLLSTGLPMGILVTEQYHLSDRIPLESGDVVLLCSDGLYEGRSPTGQVFGKQHVLDIIRDCRERSAQDIVNSLEKALTEFTQGRPQEDDITFVVAKVTQ
jgi:PAS domain S-box-containing protein